MAVESMAITNDEEMEPLLATHVGYQSVSILVYFIRVSRLVTTRSRECKFGYCVKPLIGVLCLALAYVMSVFLGVENLRRLVLFDGVD